MEAIVLVVVVVGRWWRRLAVMVNGSRGLGGWAGPSWICLSPEPPGQERMGGWVGVGGAADAQSGPDPPV